MSCHRVVNMTGSKYYHRIDSTIYILKTIISCSLKPCIWLNMLKCNKYHRVCRLYALTNILCKNSLKFCILSMYGYGNFIWIYFKLLNNVLATSFCLIVGTIFRMSAHDLFNTKRRNVKTNDLFIIIIKKFWQCKAGRGRLTPYQSEDPSPTLPTYRGKEKKGKIVENKKGESS